jgi:hypothetical protein
MLPLGLLQCLWYYYFFFFSLWQLTNGWEWGVGRKYLVFGCGQLLYLV